MCSSGLFLLKSLVISQFLFSIITANDSEGWDVDGFNKFWLALQVISNAKYRNKQSVIPIQTKVTPTQAKGHTHS